jgi:pimeloyl-ACP methyl ester carboxylesterase
MCAKPGAWKPNIAGLAAAWTLVAVALVGPARLLVQPGLAAAAPAIPYGQNPERGCFARLCGIDLYFEVYGSGQVVLQIHGNGQSIASMGDQLKFFSQHYRVIAVDSRGHGKSQMGSGQLTYDQMADDLNELLEQLNLKSVYLLGCSDGGITGLLMAIKYPDKVSKLAIMGANLLPSGACDWAREWVDKQNEYIGGMIAKGDTSEPWVRRKQLLDLLGKQPNISLADLHKITVPTLVMAADKDVIRIEHTIEIFQNIKNAHLCIFPGTTHFIAQENPRLFNETVFQFFQRPFARPDTKEMFK